MANSKVQLANGEVVMDITDSNITPETMLAGAKGYGANGEPVMGCIARRSASTITPGTSDQTIPAGGYLDGAQTIKGDPNLVSENIVAGKSIFGIQGSATTGGGADVVVKSANGSGQTSLSFSGLPRQPRAFFLLVDAQFSASSTRCVVGVVHDGSTTHGTWNYQGSSWGYGTMYHSSSYFSWTHENGTLIVKTASNSNGGVFRNGTAYRLIAIT